MIEKLKTFIVTDEGDFIIFCGNKLIKAHKREDGLFWVLDSDDRFLFNKKDIVELFNLDLEVENEN